MSFHRKSWPAVGESPYRSDEIDALIHWALRDSVAGEEPPPEIWHKIRAGLEQSKVQSHPRRERFLVAQLSWLVQLLVVGIIILVAFGLSLRQGFEPAVNREYVVNDGRTPQPGSEEVVPFSTDDHMLSGYHLFQSARKLTIFDHRLAP